MPDSLFEKVAVGGWWDCWPWMGAKTSDGYGTFGTPTQYAHRAVYEELASPIPEGLELDHVRAWGCTDRSCCNPLHLEPVTHQENQLRSDSAAGRNARKTHCKHGHEFTPGNTHLYQGKRICRTCRALRRRLPVA